MGKIAEANIPVVKQNNYCG